MKIFTRQFSHRTGFTLVEMLAAVAVIAILISLIVPALTMVKKSADMAKQRAQFHSIEIALEAFRADFGDYPESENTYKPDEDPPLLAQSYCGAQKLAEALIGYLPFTAEQQEAQSYQHAHQGQSRHNHPVRRRLGRGA